MTFHEFGPEDGEVLVMLHPLGVWWDVFDRVIPILERRFHLVIPAMPGHDPDHPETDYTSVENIAGETADWLLARGHRRVACLYGCSMGGGVVARMIADRRIAPDCAVMDGGMTPYQLPRFITRLIAVRDFCMMELGKHASLGMLRSVFDPNKYTDEDLRYVRQVIAGMSARTIWRSFDSANNYAMPDPLPRPDFPVQYWYGGEEKQARKWDIEWIRRAFPDAVLVENSGQGHAEFFTLHPQTFAEQLTRFIDASRAGNRRPVKGKECGR